METYALIISRILSGKYIIGPRRLSIISKAVIKSAISKNLSLILTYAPNVDKHNNKGMTQ